MLAVCDRHAADNRYRFNVTKCEVVSSESRPQPQDFYLHGSPVPLSSHFTYLGCTFGANGIDWSEHWKRMVQKALTSTRLMADAGLKGREIGVTGALAAFRTFVRPVLEYGLALCPKSSTHAAALGYNKCIRWMASSGNGASADIIGLFGNLEPFLARHERLLSRFFLRANRLASRDGEHFAVVDALKSSANRSVAGSIFKGCRNSLIVKAWLRSLAGATGVDGEPEAASLSWAERKERWMDDSSRAYQSGYVFRGHDRASRARHHQAFSALTPRDQHAILIWCLNRATGSWRYCWRCRVADGTKQHVEQCILGVRGTPRGPSILEDRLREARESSTATRAVAGEIRRVIGETPIDTKKNRTQFL